MNTENPASAKKYFALRVLATTLFGAALGVALIVFRVYATEAFDVLVIAMGLLTAVMNLPSLAVSAARLCRKPPEGERVSARGEWINLVLALLGVALGAALMLLQKQWLLLPLAAYSFLFPLTRTVLAPRHFAQLKSELPRVFAGVAMIVIFAAEAEERVFFWSGVAALALTALYLAWGLLALRFRFPKAGKNDPARPADPARPPIRED